MDGLLGLVVALAHFHGAVDALEAHARHPGRDGARFHGLGLANGLGQHQHGVVAQAVDEVLVELALEARQQRVACQWLRVGAEGRDQLDPALPCCPHGAGNAEVVAVEGIEVRAQASFARSPHDQRQIGTEVRSDDGIGPGLLDLGDIGGVILDLAQRVEVIAHDLQVGALGRQHAACGARDFLAIGIVGVEQKDLLHLLLPGQIGGQRGHLHVRIRIGAKVPVAASGIGHLRCLGRIVQVDDFLAGVAAVVLFDGFLQCQAHGRGAGTLHHIADVLSDDGVELAQRLLCGEAVVEGHDLELHGTGPALLVGKLGAVLEALEYVQAQPRHGAAHGIQRGNLHHRGRLRMNE